MYMIGSCGGIVVMMGVFYFVVFLFMRVTLFDCIPGRYWFGYAVTLPLQRSWFVRTTSCCCLVLSLAGVRPTTFHGGRALLRFSWRSPVTVWRPVLYSTYTVSGAGYRYSPRLSVTLNVNSIHLSAMIEQWYWHNDLIIACMNRCWYWPQSC